VKRVLTLGSVATAVLVMATPAWALTGYDQAGASSSCTWIYSTTGAQPYAFFKDYVYATSKEVEVKSGSYSYADAGLDCGTGGYETEAYQIKLIDTYRLTGSSLSSCSAGFPNVFSCTASSTQDTYTYYSFCRYNQSRCTHDFGPMYFDTNGNFNNITHQVTAIYYNSSGNTKTIQTPQEGVYNF